ncbi:hypothetical protein JF110_001643 [Campylobacter jejuni]|nr:hypothetical protein [Campylobacter jejuni]
MKKAIFLIINSVVFLAILIGCSTPKIQYITEYQTKYIPIKCEVIMPSKPKFYKNDIYKTLDEVLVYSEKLQIIVDNCAKVDYNNTKQFIRKD